MSALRAARDPTRPGSAWKRQLAAFLAAGIAVACTIPLLASFQRSKHACANEDVRALAKVLQRFARDHGGRFPATLTQLLAAGTDGTPYFDRTLPTHDPWRRPYRYACDADATGFRVWSAGADGAPGGTGDARDVYVAHGRRPEEVAPTSR